jgi:hypothetical protein
MEIILAHLTKLYSPKLVESQFSEIALGNLSPSKYEEVRLRGGVVA